MEDDSTPPESRTQKRYAPNTPQVSTPREPDKPGEVIKCTKVRRIVKRVRKTVYEPHPDVADSWVMVYRDTKHTEKIIHDPS